MADALNTALRLLARRDYFRAELGGRLARREFTREEVEAALARCEALGLIDDERVARRFVELRAAERGWGPLRLGRELRRRGVDRALVESLTSALPVAVAEAAMATALRRAERRARDGWWRLPQGRARMVSSLAGRGFETGDAIRAVHELAAERESEHDARDDQPGDPVDLP